MNKRHLVLLLVPSLAIVGCIFYVASSSPDLEKSPPETRKSELSKNGKREAREGRDVGQEFSMPPSWENSILSGEVSAANYLIGSKSLRSDRAIDMLKSDKFGQLISHLSSESANTLLASEHTSFIGDVLTSTLDKISSSTSHSCSDRLCLISIESEMDESHLNQWRSMFASQMDPLGKVLVNDTRILQGEGSRLHMLLVTDPNVQGAGVEINAFPLVVTSKPEQ